MIAAKTSEKLLSAVTASFGAAALSGEPDTEGLDPDVAKILASVSQGLELRDYLVRLAWQNRINPEFEGKPVMAKEDGKTINMKKGGLQLTVVGPMQPELRRLQKAYDKFLKEHPEKKKATAALAAFTKDNSIPNLSSIVVLAEVGDKRMLLTGDARGDKILQGLQLTGRLGPDKASTFHVDVLKAPHHGSARNLEPDFFERITAKHYVFSGNGDYGNPERETLEMLWKARGDADYTIHLTYLITDIDAMRQKDWLKEQNKERRNNKPVRPDWSPAQHSLTAFFDAHETFKNKVSIVEKDKPHVINLLDEVGF